MTTLEQCRSLRKVSLQGYAIIPFSEILIFFNWKMSLTDKKSWSFAMTSSMGITETLSNIKDEVIC